jgi:site-specific DNA-methyltransferase (adenine-specific)
MQMKIMSLDKYINQIICADCLDVLKEMPDKCVDLVLTDPPYGIFKGIKSASFNPIKTGSGGGYASKYKNQVTKWDDKPNPIYFDEINRISNNQIIWGANYFGYPFYNFIIWKKLTITETFSMSMAEIASVSAEGNGKVVEFVPQDPNRFHQTQKPVKLFTWCLANYSKENDLILDPFSGSGTTAIACHRMNRRFICIEKEEKYVNLSRERLRVEQMQEKLPL